MSEILMSLLAGILIGAGAAALVCSIRLLHYRQQCSLLRSACYTLADPRLWSQHLLARAPVRKPMTYEEFSELIESMDKHGFFDEGPKEDGDD